MEKKKKISKGKLIVNYFLYTILAAFAAVGSAGLAFQYLIANYTMPIVTISLFVGWYASMLIFAVCFMAMAKIEKQFEDLK